MKEPTGGKTLSAAKEIAYIAIMTALLIGGQLVFSYVAGIEVVTLLLVCFSYVFGVKDGMLTAAAFSLLRCFIWGFYPNVILLYLIYYPMLAAVFGLVGHIKPSFFENPEIWFIAVFNAAAAAVIAVCVFCALSGVIKISVLYKPTLNTFLWVIAALFAAMALAFDAAFALKKIGVIKSGNVFKVAFCTIIAAVCTICFTLLDDVISPLVVGMTAQTALTYFYASFMVMLPQTVCAIVSVSAMFLPLTKILKMVKK